MIDPALHSQRLLSSPSFLCRFGIAIALIDTRTARPRRPRRPGGGASRHSQGAVPVGRALAEVAVGGGAEVAAAAVVPLAPSRGLGQAPARSKKFDDSSDRLNSSFASSPSRDW